MGWGLKIGLFLFALIAAYFGAWILTVPILVLLFLPSVLNRKRGNRPVRVAPNPTKRKGWGWLPSAAGAGLVLLSFVAILSGGILSPIVFAAAGFALLLRNRLSIRIVGPIRPVRDSILLRRGIMPFAWSAVAEVKVSTRDLEGALSGVNGTVILTSNPNPRILLAYSTSSLSRARAEEGLTRQFQTSARALYPVGVYLLPLDSTEAASVAVVCADVVDIPAENVGQFISAADYGTAVAEAEQGFVTRFELYARPDAAKRAKSILTNDRRRGSSQLLHREFLREALQRIGTPPTDRYVAFLSSMAATEGEELGQRITQTTEGQQEQVLLVTSVGSPQVELTRAQLRAVSAIYL